MSRALVRHRSALFCCNGTGYPLAFGVLSIPLDNYFQKRGASYGFPSQD